MVGLSADCTHDPTASCICGVAATTAATILFLTVLLCAPVCSRGAPRTNHGLSRLEQEELAFMRSSLKREVEDMGATETGSGESGKESENVIRRAYRNIARRYKRNIFNDPAKFEFQMRVLNLARDALVNGEGLGGTGTWGPDEPEDKEENATVGQGHELPGGSRASEDILKQMHSWQEFALEEGVHFDKPETPYFVGHTQHAFEEAFAANWSHFVRTELVGMWPAMTQLRLQVELDGRQSGEARQRAEEVEEAARQLGHDALTDIIGAVHGCGLHDPHLTGHLPEPENREAWVDLQLHMSKSLRVLFTSNGEDAPPCATMADKETRLALLELSLEALEQLGGNDGDGKGRADIAAEIRATHTVIVSMRAEAIPLQCQVLAKQTRASLDHFWEEYMFGDLIREAYPLDACGLEGLAAFLDYHSGRAGDLLTRRVEPDRTMLRALHGLMALQRALSRPASLALEQWREALTSLEDAVWQGVAFPDLHDAVGQLLAEVASEGLLPAVLEAMLEHPRVKGGADGTTLRHGREPSDVQPARGPRFVGLDVPGYSLKPIQRYEERALHLWGDEEAEERWDPIRLGLAYIDLTPACDLPLQVAMCFISAALWLWRALQLLGDNCGGDAWLEDYVFEDLWSVPPEAKRLAVQFALKRAIMELIEYASQMAEHQLMPGARLAVYRSAYLIARKVTARFGTEEDAPQVLAKVRRMLTAARLNPLWAPPVLPVTDAVFVDILGGRLHSAFMEKLYETGGLSVKPEAAEVAVLPSAVTEYTLYEAALLGGSDTTYTRFAVMDSLLHDSGRSWNEVENLLPPAPWPVDLAGFTVGLRSGPAASLLGTEEFATVRGIRMDLASGQASLLLTRPSVMVPPLLSLEDIARLLAVDDPSPLHVTFGSPEELGAGVGQYPHHPFQRAAAGPVGLDRRTEVALLRAALTLQQVAAGTEVAIHAPFPTRPCEEGFCRGLPGRSSPHLKPLTNVRGDPWETPPRIVLECARLPYWQRQIGSTLEVWFGEPAIEAHPGKPLRTLNEEEFRTWPVAKLRKALKRVEEEGWKGNQDELPALEKQELVERLVRALEDGGLLEDEDEASDAAAHFARRLTHHLPSVREQWPHLAKLGPLCAVRAAGLVLQLQLQQVNASASEQTAALRSSAAEQVDGMRQQQVEGWRGILAEVHMQVLRELGFVDFDPGGCFGDGSGHSFARCCSIGDHAQECWGLSQVGGGGNAVAKRPNTEELRCCGPASRRSGFSPQLIASVAAQLGSSSPRQPGPEELIPAVSKWLHSPTGQGQDGKLCSAAVVDLLAEEVNEDDLVQHTADQIRQPVQRFTSDLAALANLHGGEPALLAPHAETQPSAASVPKQQGPNSERQPRPSRSGEHWLPAALIASTGGRRVVHTTVALAPELQPLMEEDAEAAGLPASVVEEVPLAELRRLVEAQEVEAATAAQRAGAVGEDPELQALHGAVALLHELDMRTEELERGGGGTPAPSAPTELELPDCSPDGWLELPTEVAVRSVNSSDRVRLRWRSSEDVQGQEGVLRAALLLAGEPGVLDKTWQVDMSHGNVEYFDFTNTSLAVAVPCNHSIGNEAAGGPKESGGAAAASWPSCVEANVAASSSDSAGLFVNLGAFGIGEGCFRGDCSHSDHFACASPAECARTCAKIRACRRWTFWEMAPGTCWLRGAVPPESLREAAGVVSGSAACRPPPEEAPSHQEPTLFKLVGGPAGTLPPAFVEEWNLAAVLKEFGHMTLSEVQRSWPSHEQRTALRIAATSVGSVGCSIRNTGCIRSKLGSSGLPGVS